MLRHVPVEPYYSAKSDLRSLSASGKFPPQAVSVKQSVESLSRRDPARVRKILRELRDKKLAHESQEGYHLTLNGVRLAAEEIKKLKSDQLAANGTGKASRRRKRH
jgi:hypothetical protein